MSSAFTIDDEIDVDASPLEVWLAITVGARIDSWFMGRTEIEPRAGGTARTDLDGVVTRLTVTAWQPPTRLTYAGIGPDGAHAEFEWRIDKRVGGGSTVHFTHRGRATGDDGQSEIEALKKGDPMYVRKLAHYLEFFNGQIATHNVTVNGPLVTDAREFWATLKSRLGLGPSVSEWDPVQVTLDGLGSLEGVVDYVTPEFLGVRTSTGLYRFMHGPDGTVIVEHHDFGPGTNGHATADAWRAWLAQTFNVTGGSSDA